MLWTLMQACWQHHSSDRPTMEAALQWLEGMQKMEFSDDTPGYNSVHRSTSEGYGPSYGLAKVDVLSLPDRFVVLPPVDFLRQQRRSAVEDLTLNFTAI